MQKVTIFGCGWLGEPLADFLTEEGFKVLGTVWSDESFNKLQSKPFEVLQADISRVDEIPRKVFESDVFVVAIPYKVTEHFEWLVKRIETAGIQKVLYVSSTSVYASNNDWVNELDGPMNPDSKIYKVEDVFRKANFPAAFVRFSGLIGPKRHPGRFFQRSGRSLGQPDAPVNFIHLSDCIGIIHQVIVQNAWGRVFNGCGPHHPKKRAFYRWAAQDAGFDMPEIDESQTLSYKIVDGNKATLELGYEYKVKNFYSSSIYRTLE